ncbi:phosphopantetheine-binding protein [Streptomyces sindenensis]|uniref:phosphopantetheine-binding protein n=1 Tax=Streptomyces sindenensis TaxID=67363 RepID=UPI001678E39B|nr:phosphopantetheine-binding protein [Streptomyces sindenensis]
MIDEARGSQGDPAGYQQFLMALAEFYCQGYEPGLEHLFAEPPAFVSLPTQPFAARHCWVGAHAARQQAAAAAAAAPAAPVVPVVPAAPVAPAAHPAPAQRTTSAPPLPQLTERPVPVEPAERAGGTVRLLPVEAAAALVAAQGQAPDRDAQPRISLRPLATAGTPAPGPVTPDSPTRAAAPAARRAAATVAPAGPPATTAMPAAVVSGEVLERLRVSLAGELFVEVEEVDPDRSFTELGLDSVVGVEWVRVVNEEFGTSIGATRIYQYPNVREFAAYVASLVPAGGGGAVSQGVAVVSRPVPEQRVVEPVSVGVVSGEVLERLRVSLAGELFVEVEEVDPDRSFTELGLDSVVGVEWVRVVNEEFGTSIGATRIYQYPNLREFAAHVIAEIPPPADDLAEMLAKVYDGQIDVQQAEARLGMPKTEA